MFLRRATLLLFVLTALSCAASAQDAAQTGSQPIYRVTIISRTTKAVNYGHRTEPTRIDFKGTELMSEARGDAVVESRRGSVLINAHFDHLSAPQRFGPEYMTYVLWAISPDGHPQNLGEVVPNSGDKAKLQVSTPMQAFALIVTAEPYFSISQPSNAVVMENSVRPDTVGKIEEVDAKYELMPRKTLIYEPGKQVAMGPAVSMGEYESTVAIYQAQNAIQLAKASGADHYAADEIAKANSLLQEAQTYKKDSKRAVSTAREAAQAAEDARLIAVRRAENESAPSTSAREIVP